mmetsp:Transcript_15229/g.38725  ORF Transcript_15229/g.38725 Transcript_15229/m.38725 type:complete len:211 (+) Transcript_15229:382-1014(+)
MSSCSTNVPASHSPIEPSSLQDHTSMPTCNSAYMRPSCARFTLTTVSPLSDITIMEPSLHPSHTCCRRCSMQKMRSLLSSPEKLRSSVATTPSCWFMSSVCVDSAPGARQILVRCLLWTDPASAFRPGHSLLVIWRMRAIVASKCGRCSALPCQQSTMMSARSGQAARHSPRLGRRFSRTMAVLMAKRLGSHVSTLPALSFTTFTKRGSS